MSLLDRKEPEIKYDDQYFFLLGVWWIRDRNAARQVTVDEVKEYYDELESYNKKK